LRSMKGVEKERERVDRMDDLMRRWDNIEKQTNIFFLLSGGEESVWNLF